MKVNALGLTGIVVVKEEFGSLIRNGLPFFS
jgi:hypothetical protein